MKGYAKPLHEFIEGHKIQFVIPVYQRNYDWLIDNCDQLFSDLVKLSQSRLTRYSPWQTLPKYQRNTIEKEWYVPNSTQLASKSL